MGKERSSASNVGEVEKPRDLSGYLEIMTKAIFKSGLSLKTVEAKWDGFLEAFMGFDVGKVAALTEQDLDSLAADPAIIRSRPKIEATVSNAQRLLEIESEYGSFNGYLTSFEGFDDMLSEVKREFAYVGDASGHWFLYYSGADVPQYKRKPSNA